MFTNMSMWYATAQNPTRMCMFLKYEYTKIIFNWRVETEMFSKLLTKQIR